LGRRAFLFLGPRSELKGEQSLDRTVVDQVFVHNFCHIVGLYMVIPDPIGVHQHGRTYGAKPYGTAGGYDHGTL
jgi:hypothetical protein